eukprot:2397151-Prorocentrum_lima.AAC.1
MEAGRLFVGRYSTKTCQVTEGFVVARWRQAHHRAEAEASELRQQIVLLEQQQVHAMDASQRHKYGCQ